MTSRLASPVTATTLHDLSVNVLAAYLFFPDCKVSPTSPLLPVCCVILQSFFSSTYLIISFDSVIETGVRKMFYSSSLLLLKTVFHNYGNNSTTHALHSMFFLLLRYLPQLIKSSYNISLFMNLKVALQGDLALSNTESEWRPFAGKHENNQYKHNNYCTNSFYFFYFSCMHVFFSGYYYTSHHDIIFEIKS